MHVGGQQHYHGDNISLVREPLELFCDREPETRILILVDSLDEALTYDGHENIVSLLETNRDLPPQVRFILTSRPDDQVQSSIGKPTLDLTDNAPDATSDVRAYALFLKAQQCLFRIPVLYHSLRHICLLLPWSIQVYQPPEGLSLSRWRPRHYYFAQRDGRCRDHYR